MPVRPAQVAFRSKLDPAMLGVLMISPLACTIALAAAWATSPTIAAGLTLTLLPGIGLPLWVLNTAYVFEGEVLKVTSGPFRWRVPVGHIVGVEPSRSPQSGPALSFDRLLVRYGPGAGLLVSPQDKPGFRREIQARGGRLR